MQRLVFIDRMKVMGMYFIILGHMFPAHNEFIYAFNVPLFFILSGLLLRKENDPLVFWRKLWYNLILPLIIICFINAIFDAIILFLKGELTCEFFLMRLYALLIGDGHGEHGGLRSCWFIYTLVLGKIMFQYSYRKYLNIALILICIVGTIAITRYDIETTNSFPALLISYPFLMCGFSFKKHLLKIDSRIDSVSFMNKLVLVCFCAAIFFYAVYSNGSVWMYSTRYGGNYLSFWLGSISGFIIIYILSSFLFFINEQHIEIVSSGTIIILGFHQMFIFPYKYFGNYTIWQETLYSLFILLLFYPIILMCKKYFPLLLGKR